MKTIVKGFGLQFLNVKSTINEYLSLDVEYYPGPVSVHLCVNGVIDCI